MYLISILCLALVGCTSYGPDLSELRQESQERARENNTGIFDTLSELPKDENSPEIALAKTLARDNELLLGIPAERLNVKDLLSQNQLIKASAWRYVEAKRRDDSERTTKMRELELKLESLGRAKEVENNKNTVGNWFKGIFATLGIGGTIALIVFCPALIPIIAQLLSWVVSLIPQAVHLVGVVGKGFAENVVKGIGEARTKLRANPEATYTSTEVLTMLDNELRAALDSKDKAVIDQFRAKFNL